jgi:large subunit ribosomal protein L18
MKIQERQQASRFRRKMRVRNRIRRSRNPRPRLSVFRSTKHISVQVIDDIQGRTLAAASSLEKDMRAQFPNGGNVATAAAIGALIAQRCAEAGIKDVAFDRGQFRYHGRVKALADAARGAGMNF